VEGLRPDYKQLTGTERQRVSQEEDGLERWSVRKEYEPDPYELNDQIARDRHRHPSVRETRP
jgi:hypothetical protein